ncbi:UDP-N-acetylmuramate dehydrogenase [Robertkochia aurantiaca]|uniref:UDP-N-acetylmuramate dehydrogenase n=1 Tax=Robertkochia aurantiaca TaxID=2873700 RepID=UPI001CCF9024|nr:UDP-N-acetylmuramate dehydrogenase [Robertkochia sp. 3YJGBD-33]
MHPDIQTDKSLKEYNTFKIDSRARFFVSVNTEEELARVLQLEDYPEKFILGGGSNLLLTTDLDALVVHIGIKGKEVVGHEKGKTLVRIAAGENWHETVLWSLEKQLGGLENLSLIPGNTGTAPVQNIGAYGVELKDVFVSCEAMEIASGKIVTFTKDQCRFGYRDSIFKNEAKGKFIITSVVLELTSEDHRLNTSYGAIDKELQSMGIDEPGIEDVSKAVIRIRQSKLPDPAEIGNSGSFFKNPVIDRVQFERLQKNHPDMPHYEISHNEFKVPAGWLIEQCGFKGKRFGDAGVHDKQALVLVNHGNAKGQEIYDLAIHIQNTVMETFGIAIENEVNII